MQSYIRPLVKPQGFGPSWASAQRGPIATPTFGGQAIGDRRPFNEFQRECDDAVGLFKSVDMPDVLVVQRREDLRFTAEARESLGAVRDFGEDDLQSDVAIELGVMCPIDLAHPAGANLRGDLVGTEACARNQCQTA